MNHKFENVNYFTASTYSNCGGTIYILDPKDTTLETHDGFWIRYFKEVDDNEQPIKFQRKLFSLTGVEIETERHSILGISELDLNRVVTAQDIAETLFSYIKGEIDSQQLVSRSLDWMFVTNIAATNSKQLLVILAKLGASNIKGFGLGWTDYENIFRQLGFALQLTTISNETILENKP